MRRNELAELDVESTQLRECRWVLADLEGKGRRIRTVAVPIWIKQAINAWLAAAAIEAGGDLEQIKFLLGHSSIQTTERYLGSVQEIAVAVNDDLDIA